MVEKLVATNDFCFIIEHWLSVQEQYVFDKIGEKHYKILFITLITKLVRILEVVNLAVYVGWLTKNTKLLIAQYTINMSLKLRLKLKMVRKQSLVCGFPMK